MVLLLVSGGLACAVTWPAWRVAGRRQQLFRRDIATLFAPTLMLVILEFLGIYRDDDGALSVAAALLFPFVAALATYLRVFLINDRCTGRHGITSILSFALLVLVMPLTFALVFEDVDFCAHCEGAACYARCGG